MSKYASIVIAILVLGMFTGIEAGNVAQAQDVVVQEVGAPVMPPADQIGNITKIDISPQYGNFRLQPGESKEITVTIRNKEKNAVSVKPNTVILPYGGYMVDAGWITVKPGSADIPAGGSQKFTIKAEIPKDASIGSSSLQIAFTNETIPTPYPQPFPNYIHAFQFSVDVWMPPKLQIMMPYISDQLEAGKEYDYEIKLKNTGDQAIGISPKLGSDDMYYGGPYGMMAPALTEDSITITAPTSIAAGATDAVKIHVRVPADAKGYYNGYIDLGIDDPSVREWEGRVQLNFNIWTQPTGAFVRSFNLTEAAPITVEVSSNNYYYGYPYAKGTNAKAPSFETSLEGPGGKAPLTVNKTVIRGNVNMGGDRPPWEMDSASIYQEMGVQYVVTYKTDGTPGEWKLSVLPRNTQGFDYSITIGG